ncbi:hypothetical protein QBC34DRAFT_297056 [Podospora aff. communis PSN243]|uniref:F-box domain-containing protein n=1 Tax=Podospora aff. communis PSN243 TaxID=3040156 RepID=A0AAV9GR63_9PEZI|nr:hypothetical protein QBC34DRAFT_297056 [Podospora aff. communis PSN243]
MGQLASWLPQLASAPRANANSTSLLLQMPVEIILHIYEKHLPLESALALSLTCKDLSAIVPPSKIIGPHFDFFSRPHFLLLLERDPGRDHYCCHDCLVLHRFSPEDGPALYILPNGDCRKRDPMYFFGSHYMIYSSNKSHRHVRLALNRHLFGPPHGLPLERFQLESWSYYSLRWHEKWSARIVQGELFVSCKRTIRWLGDAHGLRRNLDADRYSVCSHVHTGSHWILPISELHRMVQASPLVQWKDAVGSCNYCLTDYDTTIEWQSRSVRRWEGAWLITSVSYHRLGDGRSPSDPVWRAATARVSWGRTRYDSVSLQISTEDVERGRGSIAYFATRHH